MKNQNDLVKELFSFLDIVEVSDEGYEFHPIHISCCRIMKIEALEECIKKLRESIYVS